MQGEYRGDFTRDTFHQANHFCRVLMQQGRVQLDADWNEQTSIVLHFLRSLTRDVIGPFGGSSANGFLIGTDPDAPADLTIGTGNYYVDGLLCEADLPPGATTANSPGLTYLTQPDLPNAPALPTAGNALVYLDVWERHLTSVQQDLIREVALGGPDTASRSRVACQVKILPNLSGNLNSAAAIYKNWPALVWQWQSPSRGLLIARIQPQPMSTDACTVSPQSAYRGTENQLYRVEIHYGNNDVSANGTALGPTYKWSRENGSVVFPILKLASSAGANQATQITVTLASLGRDSRLSLKFNDWVEIVDDASDLNRTPSALLQVTDIDFTNLVVTLASTAAAGDNFDPTKFDLARHPLLRRWEGQGPLVESATNWLTLEDGIQIQFQPGVTGNLATQYRSGNYWLIPARVATGAIEWPVQLDAQGNPVLDANKNPLPAALPPHGVEHHFAPLALYTPGQQPTDIRRIFIPLTLNPQTLE